MSEVYWNLPSPYMSQKLSTKFTEVKCISNGGWLYINSFNVYMVYYIIDVKWNSCNVLS